VKTISEIDRLSDVVTKARADNLVEAQEATSLMNFTVRCLEQRLKDAVCEVDEYRRAIVDLEAKIKRLEEAGNKMAGRLYDGWPDLDGNEVIADMDALVEGWNEAKESKP
jgi:hypothetical protein